MILSPEARKWLFLLVSIIGYLAIGCLYYTLNEEKPCESQERLSAPDYDPTTCAEPWDLVDALYFSMVSMSTVGYGDLSPEKGFSKVFTLLFIFVGITVVFVQVSEALTGVVDCMESRVFALINWLFVGRYAKQVHDIDGDGIPGVEIPPGPAVYWVRHLAFPVTVLVVVQFISAAVFTFTQDDLVYWDAFYHCMVTATTVGYGDIRLTTKASKVWAFFHIAVSVSWLAALISEVGERKKIRNAELLESQMLARQLDTELITSLNRSGQGVDKLEFVVGMLIEVGVEFCGRPMSWEDVDPFLNQFDHADRDKSGLLTQEDLEIMVELRRSRAGEANLEKARTIAERSKSDPSRGRKLERTDNLSGNLLRSWSDALQRRSPCPSSPSTMTVESTRTP